MKFIFNTSSSDENYKGDCDYAVVELTKDAVLRLLKYREFFKEIGLRTRYQSGAEERILLTDQAEARYNGVWVRAADSLSSLVTMEFWDNSPDYFSAAQELPKLFEPGDDWIQVPDDWKPDEDQVQRTECGCVQIWDDHIRWSTRVKHVDRVVIETGRMSYNELEELLKEIP